MGFPYGAGLQPVSTGSESLEFHQPDPSAAKPISLLHRERREHDLEVSLVRRAGPPGFVEQHDLRRQKRDGVAHENRAIEVASNRWIAPVDPRSFVALVEQELERGLSTADGTRVNLVNRQREPLVSAPWSKRVVVRNLQRPIRSERRSKLALIVAPDGEIEVGVLARLAPEEEVERPSTGDGPRNVVGRQDLANSPEPIIDSNRHDA